MPVAKSNLSDWFREIGLSERHRHRLTARKLAGSHRGAQKLHEQKLLRIASTLSQADREAHPLLKARELLWVIGTMLYWAEGAKVREWGGDNGRLTFTNTDPLMILLVRNWLLRYCSVSASDIVYALYIHQDANIPAARKFWARRLNIDQSELRTYLKRHKPEAPKTQQQGILWYSKDSRPAKQPANLQNRGMELEALRDTAGWANGRPPAFGAG